MIRSRLIYPLIKQFLIYQYQNILLYLKFLDRSRDPGADVVPGLEQSFV